MKAGDAEIGDREKTKVIPQAVQEADALRARREGTATTSTDDGGEDNGPPAKSATADEWKAWAVAAGHLTEEEAADTTKTALVEKYG